MVAATCITVQYTLQVGGIGKKEWGEYRCCIIPCNLGLKLNNMHKLKHCEYHFAQIKSHGFKPRIIHETFLGKI